MKDFKVLDTGITYLDNAATSLTPNQVVQSLVDYYEKYNANIHRGIHKMSEEASRLYDEAHEKVAKFIGADSDEIIFTKSTTESLNLLAYNFQNENIVVTEMEHHSNLVPWQQLAKVKFCPIAENGELDLDKLKELITEDTKLVSVTHVSNVLGTINPIKEIAKIAHSKGALICVDAAQAVPHMPVDVKDLDVDFLVFSGHKMLGPTGIGVLYGKKKLLENMKPFLYGGDMVKDVSLEKTTFNDLPWKFEAGTPNIAGGIALGIAVDYLNNIGMETIFKHSQKLAKQCATMLKELGADVYGPEERSGVVSFNLPGAHALDVSTILDQENIATRSGHHCAMPLHEKLGVTNSCRASFYIYNNEEDIEKLKKGLLKAKGILKC